MIDNPSLSFIRSIYAKIHISFILQNARSNRFRFDSPKDLENYCISHGLDYHPNKYPFYETTY